jgi:iron complex transport system substrate-binding protein
VSVDRVVCLVPAATEILFELDVGDRVRAVSHACNHPPEARELPSATRVRVDGDGSSREIDESVREAADASEPVYEVLQDVLHHAQPDVIVAQEACSVCGITPVDVRAALARFEPDEPEIVALHPHTLDDVLDDVGTLAEAVGVPERGRELVDELQARIEAVADCDSPGRPRVAVMDWVDPPMAAGHWVPDMVSIAGGEPTLVGAKDPSTYVDLDDVREVDPERLVLAPCGFDAKRALAEAREAELLDALSGVDAVERGEVYAVDAGAYVSRPGPRLVDGLEQLACIVDPGLRDRYPEQVERVVRVEASG